MKLKKDALWLLSLSVLLGVLVSTQLRSSAVAEEGSGSQSNASVQRAQELLLSVSRLEEENQALQSRLGEVNQRLAEYENAMHDSGEMSAQLKKSLETARMEAGLVELTGQGLVVTIDNLVLSATGQVVKYVQDEDLLSVVNELNAAGAEAIAINGERLVATSEIRSAGNFININTRSHAAPFVIQAIGNPQTLNAAMHLYGGVLETLAPIARVDAQMVEQVRIPAYQGAILYEYAQIVS